MEKIWEENAQLIYPEEVNNAKIWLDSI